MSTLIKSDGINYGNNSVMWTGVIIPVLTSANVCRSHLYRSVINVQVNGCAAILVIVGNVKGDLKASELGLCPHGT